MSVDLDGSSVNYRSCLIEIKAASDQDDTDLKSEKEVTNYCEKEEKVYIVTGTIHLYIIHVNSDV